MSKTYVVTGGAGFVGANLAAALLIKEPGAYIIVIDSFRSGSFANIVEACERRGVVFNGDVRTEGAEETVWGWIITEYAPAAVFHLGANTDTTVSDEPAMLRGNCSGFEELLVEAADAGIPLVYASSAATYGTPPQTRDRVPFPLKAAGRPNNVYGFSKWLMECQHRRIASQWQEKEGKEPHIVGLRYFNVFGPGEGRKGKMASMVYQLAQQVIAGKRPRIFADGTQARDQVFIDDVVDCTLAAAGQGRPGIYNLGSGLATSFNEIVEAIRGGLGLIEGERPTEYFEMPAEIRAFYQEYTCADMGETERGLWWKPRHEPKAAMREYARWLANA